MLSSVREISEFSRSILFINNIRGILRSSHIVHDCSVPTSTLATALTNIMAPSVTRRADTTSPLKSSYPGVSRRFILYPFFMQVIKEVCVLDTRLISSGS